MTPDVTQTHIESVRISKLTQPPATNSLIISEGRRIKVPFDIYTASGEGDLKSSPNPNTKPSYLHR